MDDIEERNPPEVGYNTVVVVRAKDQTWRDVAVCAGDTAEVIGANVIAAVNGTRVFQLSTRVR